MVFGSMLLIGSVLLGQPGASADDDLAANVRRLLAQLDSPQLARREAAEQELVKLGPAALEVLPRITERTPAEVKQRLGRIRRKLERATAESAAEASLVTLQGDAIPFSKVLAAIQEQTGNKIIDARGGRGQPTDDPELKVDFQRTPFWEALDRVLDDAKLTVYPFSEQCAISVVARSETQLPRSGRASISGPFRFEPVRIAARRDLRNPAEQTLQLVLQIAWEPQLGPISLQQPLADLKAVDAKGNPLVVDAPVAVLEVPVNPESAAEELTLPFALPPREVEEIARLEGKLTALLPGKIETFRFDEVVKAKNVEKRVASTTVVLEQTRRLNDDLWQVRIRVRLDEASGALESHRSWVYDNEAYLEGTDGKPIPHEGFETTGRSENEIGVAYLFALEEPPAGRAFVYKTPSAILSVEFNYEIRGVKLP